MGVTVKIDGLDDLNKKLSDLLESKGEQILRKGLRAGGEIFQAAVIEAAPMRIDGGGGHNANPAWDLPPGALKSDIGLRVVGNRRDGGLYAVISPGKYTRFVARMVEYGHEMHSGRKYHANSKYLGVVKAHPFIRPAFDRSENSAIDAFKEVVVSEVVKFMKTGV